MQILMVNFIILKLLLNIDNLKKEDRDFIA